MHDVCLYVLTAYWKTFKCIGINLSKCDGWSVGSLLESFFSFYKSEIIYTNSFDKTDL